MRIQHASALSLLLLSCAPDALTELARDVGSDVPPLGQVASPALDLSWNPTLVQPPAAYPASSGTTTGYNSYPGGSICHPNSNADFDSTLPAQSTAAQGASAGTFEVTQDGRAHYIVPIEIPPGVGGLMPSLSFEYDSASGNGLMGVGWQLSGLGQITRCTRHIAIDGYRRAVRLDDSDVYCLNGKRLLEVDALQHIYRTEQESFTKVVAVGWINGQGPSSFKAFTKEGQVMFFGSDPANNKSRVLALNNVPFQWLLDKVSDRSPVGTSYYVRYVNSTGATSTTDTDVRPDYVSYNGGQMQVQFIYEDTVPNVAGDPAPQARLDLIRSYSGGLRFANPYRLTRVRIQHCTRLLKTYKLSYEYAGLTVATGRSTSTDRSRLLSLQECTTDAVSGNEACKGATRFTWQNGSSGWNAPTILADSPAPQFSFTGGSGETSGGTEAQNQPFGEAIAADLNNDGKTELIEFIERGATTWQTTTKFRVNVLSATGFTSSAIATVSGINRTNPVEPGTTAGQACRLKDAPALFPSRSRRSGAGQEAYMSHAMPLDYDNDGRLDLLLLDPTTNWTVLKQNNNSTLVAPSFTAVDTGIPRPCPSYAGYEPVVFADLDGDGLKDMVECKSANPPGGTWSWYVRPMRLSSGVWGWGAATDTHQGANCNKSEVVTMDYDGDGTDNLMVTDEVSDNSRRLLALVADNGSYALRDTGFNLPRAYDYGYERSTVMIADVSADGRPDFVNGIDHDYKQFLNTGIDFQTTGFPSFVQAAATVSGTVPSGNYNDSGSPHYYHAPRGPLGDIVVDSNRDGKPDLLVYEAVHGSLDFRSNPCSDLSCNRPVYEVLRTNPQGTGFLRSCNTDAINPSLDCGFQPGSWPWDGGTYYQSALTKYGMIYRPIVLDIDGDGIEDLLTVAPDQPNTIDPFLIETYASAAVHYEVRMGKGVQPDLLLTIRDGMNCPGGGSCTYSVPPTVSIKYDKLTNSAVYTPAPAGTCTYPQRCINGPVPVVSKVTYDAANDSVRGYNYKYEDGRTDIAGRGFLGFAKVIRTRDVTGETLVSSYDNGNHTMPTDCAPLLRSNGRHAYPCAGMLFGSTLTSYTDAAQTRTIIETTTVTAKGYFLDNAMGLVGSNATVSYFARPVIKSMQRTDNGTLVTRSDVSMSYNELGSMESLRRELLGQTPADPQIDIVTTGYLKDTANWLINQATSITESSQIMPNPAVVRTRVKTYDTTSALPSGVNGTGMLLTDTLEPSDPTKKLVNTYTRDYQQSPAQSRVGNIMTEQAVGPTGDTSTPASSTRTASYTYDSLGLFMRTKVNGSMITRYQFDRVSGQKIAELSPSGTTLRWAYDAFGRLTRDVGPDGSQAIRSLSMDNGAFAITTVRTDGLRSYEWLDRLGRVTSYRTCGAQSTWSPFYCQFISENTAFDDDGRVISKSIPQYDLIQQQFITHAYDFLGRETSKSVAGAYTTQTSYVGSTQTRTDARGNTTKSVYDLRGRLRQSVDETNASIVYFYGAFDLLVGTQLPGGTGYNAAPHMSNMAYDNYGRRTVLSDPDTDQWSTYNAFGELATEQSNVQRAASQVTSYTYDSIGRRLTRTDAESTTTWKWDNYIYGGVTYGKIAKLAAVIVSAGSSPDVGNATRYQYTAFGQIASITEWVGGESFKLSYDYDPNNGRLDTTTYPDTDAPHATANYCDDLRWFKTKNVYTDSGHLKEIRDACSTTKKAYFTLGTLDPAGRLLTESRTADNGTAITTTRTYDVQGRLNTMVTKIGSTQLMNLDYDYDANENVTKRTDTLTPRTESYTYDPANRLTQATQVSGTGYNTNVTYDPSGNIYHKDGLYYFYTLYNTNISGPSRHGVLQQWVVPQSSSTSPTNPSYMVSSFAYDANGNMTSMNGGTAAYTTFNQPRSWNKGSISTNFLYNGERHRVRKSYSDASKSTETTTIGNVYERVKAVGTTTPSLIYTYNRYPITAYGQVVAQVSRAQLNGNTPNETRAYLFNDPLGSTGLITDSTGALLERRQYNVFGELMTPAAPTVTSQGFTGQEYEGGEFNNLVNMGARMYNPKLGVFLSPDVHLTTPQQPQSYNRFAYAQNNPLKYVDPTGNDDAAPGGGEGSLVVGSEETTPLPYNASGGCLAGCTQGGSVGGWSPENTFGTLAAGALAGVDSMTDAVSGTVIFTALTVAGVDPTTAARLSSVPWPAKKLMRDAILDSVDETTPSRGTQTTTVAHLSTCRGCNAKETEEFMREHPAAVLGGGWIRIASVTGDGTLRDGTKVLLQVGDGLTGSSYLPVTIHDMPGGGFKAVTDCSWLACHILNGSNAWTFTQVGNDTYVQNVTDLQYNNGMSAAIGGLVDESGKANSSWYGVHMELDMLMELRSAEYRNNPSP